MKAETSGGGDSGVLVSYSGPVSSVQCRGMPERERCTSTARLVRAWASQAHKMKSVAGIVGDRLTIPSTPGDNCRGWFGDDQNTGF